MNACGIICEYNPFHTGHAYQLMHVKQMLGAPIVCAMSGSFTQRAESACMDKNTRAKIALDNGADIILELPFPFSSMSAGGFASAGVHILSASGLCSHIAFGSECGDIKMLTDIAKITLSKNFEADIKAFQKQNSNVSYARARCAVMEKYDKEYSEALSNPNDILAVEYIKANIMLGQPLTPIAVKRTIPRGNADDKFASSSYIRSCLFENSQNHIPAEILKYLPSQPEPCDFFTDNSLFEKLLHLSLLTKAPEDLKDIAEIPQGSQYTLIKNAFLAKSYTELTQLMRSKSFTDAKIRRMILFSLVGVKAPMLKQKPLYTNLLAYNDCGRALLNQSRKQKSIIIASKLANIKQNKEAYTQYLLSKTAEEVLYKCRLK